MSVSHMAEYSVIAKAYDAFLFTTLKTFSLPGHLYIFLLAAVSFLFTNYLTVIILVINF